MALHSVCVFPRSLTFRTKKMGNLEKNAQSTIPGSASTCQAMDFFMGSANAPRRALGRQNATFSLVTPHWSGVYAAKRPRIIAENTAKIAKEATRRAWRRRSLDFYGISQASPATREARCAPLRACAPRVTSGLRLGAGCAAGRRTHSRRLRSQSRMPLARPLTHSLTHSRRLRSHSLAPLASLPSDPNETGF